MLITSSVGDWSNGAKNNPKDVKTIQSLLTSLSILTKNAAINPQVIGVQIPKPPKSSETVAAIIAFQGSFMSKPDGVISPGKTTYQKLLAALKTAQFPTKPSFVPVLGNTAKANKFGTFKWETIKKNGKVLSGSKIRVTDGWAEKNIVIVNIPYLKSIPIAWDGSYTNKMQFHKLYTRQLKAMWDNWHKAGLINRIISYGGSYMPRLIRGSYTELSSHAWGTAFDINTVENPRKQTPAHLGDPGCVRELVAIANAHGFYWGGHFSIPDGMHFEIAKAAASPSKVITSAVVHTEVKGWHYNKGNGPDGDQPFRDNQIY
ncbi:MAG: M15 family metallopeptidase [Gammaproteobacteria bacterium]|nr:M15 family metallopeptidase [Gammaproteobacteria bacterium]MDH5653175.1 M15 family metallopeptidase [Gammaproteobacteria bacterium]